MRAIAVAGYEALFGEPGKESKHIVSSIPSRFVIPIIILINNELNALQEELPNQIRISNLVSASFNPEQKKRIQNAFVDYGKKHPASTRIVFARRYLMEFLLDEIAHYRSLPEIEYTSDFDHEVLMAYLSKIDEVHAAESLRYKEITASANDPEFERKFMWTTMIAQFEFNDNVTVGYEFFRLIVMVKYFLQNHKKEIAEYIGLFGFSAVGQYLKSVFTMSKATLHYDPDNLFTTISYVNANGETPLHLDHQCINPYFGKPVSLDTLRINPVYKDETGRYQIIDAAYYRKKISRGFFFEIFRMTSLKTTFKSFDHYSSQMGSELS
jgi:hypothetical protein